MNRATRARAIGTTGVVIFFSLHLQYIVGLLFGYPDTMVDADSYAQIRRCMVLPACTQIYSCSQVPTVGTVCVSPSTVSTQVYTKVTKFSTRVYTMVLQKFSVTCILNPRVFGMKFSNSSILFFKSFPLQLSPTQVPGAGYTTCQQIYVLQLQYTPLEIRYQYIAIDLYSCTTLLQTSLVRI